jgi:hypothetical protein
MDWITASEILARKIGRHGTFMAKTEEGFIFGVGNSKARVTSDGQVLLGDQANTEGNGKPKDVFSSPSLAQTATLARIGKKATLHLAVFTPDGQVATACNPKKTFYSNQGTVQAIEGSLDQVTCKVCGWILAKRQKENSEFLQKS